MYSGLSDRRDQSEGIELGPQSFSPFLHMLAFATEPITFPLTLLIFSHSVFFLGAYSLNLGAF